MYLNEATLLNNIRARYFKDRIYVSSQQLVPSAGAHAGTRSFSRFQSLLIADLRRQHPDSRESLLRGEGSLLAAHDQDLSGKILGRNAATRIRYRYVRRSLTFSHR